MRGCLAGGTDEQAREEVRERRMVVPVGDEAGEQVGAAQERGIGGCCAAQHEMVAAAGPGVAPVEHELFGREAREARRLVERLGVLHQRLPVRGRVDVGFQHARIRRDADHLHRRVARRLVALEDHRQAQLAGGGLDRVHEVEVVLDCLDGRHEDVEHAMARLGAERRARDMRRGFERPGRTLPRRGRGGAALHGDRRARGQGARLRERIAGVHPRVVRRRDPRHGIHRQAQPEGRVAGNQVAVLLAQEPAPGDPARARRGIEAQRQDVAGLLLQALREHAPQAFALERIVDPRIEGVDVDRQPPFAPQVVPRVLVGGKDEFRIEAERARERVQEAFRLRIRDAVVLALVRLERRVPPDRRAVLAPVARERPARQLLAGVPLALPVMQQALGREMIAQAGEELGTEQALGGTHRIGVPFGALVVVGGHEGRLPAHGEAHVVPDEVRVHAMPELPDGGPLLLGVGLGDAGSLPDALDLHHVRELDAALFHRARHRGGARGLGRARERNVALAGEQARGRIEADPARAGKIDLAPRVQVGEVVVGARRPLERLGVGRELDQVAGDEARREPEVAQQLHQQPAGIAAGAACERERLLGRLHAVLEPDDVADLARQARVQVHQERDGGLRAAVDRLEQRPQPRRRGEPVQVRLQLDQLPVLVAERKALGVGLEEEIERVDDRHLHHEVDLDLELARALRKGEAGEVVRLWVLLPVDEVLRGRDAQGVRQHAGARVRSRPQPHDLGSQHHRAVVAVVRDVVEGDVDRHGQARRSIRDAAGAAAAHAPLR